MCPVNLTYGTAGIRQRDYRVHIVFKSDGQNFSDAVRNIQDMISRFNDGNYNVANQALELILNACIHIGEMRKDSINLSVADGDSIEGNEIGKFVMSKTGNFTCELINATPENKIALQAKDGQEAIVILEELSPARMENFLDAGAFLNMHEVIIIGNVDETSLAIMAGVGIMFSYSEKDTGGAVPTSTITLEKNVPTPSAFRKIIDHPYDYADILPTVTGITAVVEGDDNIEVMFPAVVGKTYLAELCVLEGSKYNVIGSKIRVAEHLNDGVNFHFVEYKITPGDYYVNVRRMVGNYPKSLYSQYIKVTVT